MTALAGCVLYLGTTFAVIKGKTFTRPEREAVECSADDDPSWKFRNPELDQWLAQIKTEKESLALRAQQLSEWQARLEAERNEISSVTQSVANLQAEFDKNVIRFKAQEADNIKHQAKLISAMTPASAAAMLNEMNETDVVRILFTLKSDVASSILETMSKSSPALARRAAMLTSRLQQVLPFDTNAVSPASPNAKP